MNILEATHCSTGVGVGSEGVGSDGVGSDGVGVGGVPEMIVVVHAGWGSEIGPPFNLK